MKSAAGNCILQIKSRAQRWRFTVECGDSGEDASLQLETAFWSKKARHRDGDSLLNVEIQVGIYLCSWKLHFGAKETSTEMEIHCQMWRFRWRFISVAGHCILEQKRQAQRWRFTIECGDSSGDSSLQLDTAFWSIRDRHTD